MKFRKISPPIVSTLCGIVLCASSAIASDHQEAPIASSQLSADIGDYYVWHDADNLNMILTFGTFNAPGMPASYSSDVLYALHFDTTVPADGISEVDIYARFAQDDAGSWGVQVFNATQILVEAPVETVTENSNATVWAGLSDDPFFFDLTGFNTTLSTGTLSFDPTRDDVAGLNITSLALQIPLNSIIGSGTVVSSWATTSSL